MESNISFGRSLTVPQFIKECGADKLGVKQNPRTGKFFMTCGTTTGKVSLKISAAGRAERPVVSLCTSPEEEAPYWMLHEQGEGLADVFSFTA